MAHAVMKASDMVHAVGEEHSDCGICGCKDAVRWGKPASMSSPCIVAIMAVAQHLDE
jgi:hypothetical protein